MTTSPITPTYTASPPPVPPATDAAKKQIPISKGVTYLVEISNDLVDWNTTGVILSDPDVDRMRTATISRSEPKQFMRLVVND